MSEKPDNGIYNISEIIKARYSCRTYQKIPVTPDVIRCLETWISSAPVIPFNNPIRISVIHATSEHKHELSRLGTYGFIRNPAGFFVGAVKRNAYHLEDFGYLFECLILYALEIGLGTCWLGGSFTRSTFTRTIELRDDEVMPAVVSFGYIPNQPNVIDTAIRHRIKAGYRLPWDEIFFDGSLDHPLHPQNEDRYREALEMVRLAPSASNLQPWRIIRDRNQYHFYIKRTPGYRKNIVTSLLQIEDLQRLDIGIAMSHFSLTNQSLGINGKWTVLQDRPNYSKKHLEYIVTWLGE